MNNFGNLIAQGNGQGNKAATGWLIYYVFQLALSIGLAIWIEGPFMFFFVGLAVYEIFCIFTIQKNIANSGVYVYEHGVMGRGIKGSLFFASPNAHTDFQFTYSQITNIVPSANNIEIHNGKDVYTCYVQDSNMINTAIINQKNMIMGQPQIMNQPAMTFCPGCGSQIVGHSCTQCGTTIQ